MLSYGIQVRRATANSNIEILEQFQAKVLAILVKTSCFTTNGIIRQDLQIEYVKNKIKKSTEKTYR